MLFVTTFVEVILQGPLAEFLDLVEEQCEIIKLGCAFDFNLEAILCEIIKLGCAFNFNLEVVNFMI